MAHIEKFKGAALGNMTAHYSRKPELERGYERSNIDAKKTYQNYNLAPHHGGLDDVEFIQHRIESLELKRKPRADAVRMCDWVVTLPSDVESEDAGRFFVAAYEHMAKTYGRENIVSSWVHMDETTPHMHFAFVPVTDDGRLSAKSLITREHLQTWHEKLSEAVELELGYRVSVLVDEQEKEERAAKYVGLEEFKCAKEAEEATKERLECLRQKEGNLATEVDNLQSATKTIAESLSEGSRSLRNAREAQKRANTLAECLEGLRERIRGLRERIEVNQRKIIEAKEEMRAKENGIRSCEVELSNLKIEKENREAQRKFFEMEIQREQKLKEAQQQHREEPRLSGLRARGAAAQARADAFVHNSPRMRSRDDYER